MAESRKSALKRFRAELESCVELLDAETPTWKGASNYGGGGLAPHEVVIKAYCSPRMTGAPLTDLSQDEIDDILKSVLHNYKIPERKQSPPPQFDPSKIEEVAALAGWTPEVSDVPGYFPDRKPGHKCLWSVKWQTAKPKRTITDPSGNEIGFDVPGIAYVLPLALGMAPELMPASFLAVELQDYAERPDMNGRGDPQAGALLERLQEDGINDGLRREIAACLLRCREYAQEYLCPWNPPPSQTIKWSRTRPDW
jgi:hypothetical protein